MSMDIPDGSSLRLTANIL